MSSDRVSAHRTGTPKPHGRRCGHQVLDIHRGLRTESTTDPRTHDSDRLGVQPEDGRQRRLHRMWCLMRDPARDALGRLTRHHEAAIGLHGHSSQTLTHHGNLGHDLGPVKGVVVGAERSAEAHVAPVGGKQQRRLGTKGRLLRHDNRQRVGLNHDDLGGVDCLRIRLGHDRGDDVADEANGALREDRPVERLGQHREGLERRQPQVVSAGVVDGQHAGHIHRVADVHRAKPAVSDRRSHKDDSGRSDRGEIVDVLPGPGQQRRILQAHDRVAEDRAAFSHGVPLVRRHHFAPTLAVVRVTSFSGSFFMQYHAV